MTPAPANHSRDAGEKGRDTQASETVALRPGIEFLVRPIQPADKHLMVAAFEQLTPETRFQRFFAPVQRLSDSDLEYLTEIDHVNHEALIAVDPEDGSLIGVARYVRTRPSNEAEVAIIVVDAWQGQGLGTVLLKRLARRAADQGIEYFLALVLVENRSARDLFQGLVPGMTETSHSSAGQVEIRIELPRPGEFEGSALARTFRSSAGGTLRVSPWRRLRRRLMRNRRRSPGKPD
ncbi:MAG: GNAT family N-acetyltransferase [Solirubrobacterales bacterium]|nr:GNAT family N-acetyltransferase [Solirubrobacterales bacterium]